MKKKIGTIIDEDILTAAKKKAISKKQPLNQFFEEALKMYISISDDQQNKNQKICEHTRGVLSIPLKDLKKIMGEESYNEA